MRCSGRMDCEASCVTDVGDVIVKLQSVNEPASGLLAAGKLEPDEPAKLASQITIGALPVNTLLNRGMDNAHDFFALHQKIDHRLRVLAVLPHAQCQRLDALNDKKRIERGKCGSDVAKERDASLDCVGNGSK